MPISGVKEFKDLRLIYESTGSGTILWKTDMPGGVIATRKTNTTEIVDTSGLRKTARVPLDGIEGQLYQLRVTPSGSATLKLFEGFVRLRIVGVYLDGSRSEFYETPEMSLA